MDRWKMQKMYFGPLNTLPDPLRCARPGARAHGGRPGLETLGGDAEGSARPQGARGEAARSAGAARREGPG